MCREGIWDPIELGLQILLLSRRCVIGGSIWTSYSMCLITSLPQKCGDLSTPLPFCGY